MFTEPYILSLLSELSKNTSLHKIIICKDDAQAQKLQKDILSLSKNFQEWIPRSSRGMTAGHSRGMTAGHSRGMTPSHENPDSAAELPCKMMLEQNDVLMLPGFLQTGVFKYESAKKIIAARLAVSQILSKSAPRIIITSVAGFARSFPSVSWVTEHTLSLKINEEYDFDSLIGELEHRVYTETKQVEDVGEYAVRGSIIDFWTPGQANPTRLEFLDNVLEKIKSFRSHDQKSFATLQSVSLLPAREFVWPKIEELETKVEQFNTQILKQKVVGINRSNLLEDLKSSIPFPGIDDVAYMFSQPFPSFLNEFKKTSLKNGPDPVLKPQDDIRTEIKFDFFATETDIEKSISDIENIYTSAWSSANENKNLLIGKFDSLFAGMPELKNSVSLYPMSEGAHSTEKVIDMLHDEGTPLINAQYFKPPKEVLETLNLLSTQKETFHDRILKLKSLLQNETIQKTIVAAKNADSGLEIVGLLAKYFPGLDPAVKPRDDKELDPAVTPRDDTVSITALDIEGCFFLPESKTFVISENLLRGRSLATEFENFSTTNTQESSAQNSQIFFSSQFSDFAEGDLVVHVQHGICRFRGLATIKIADTLSDFLVLEFLGNDKIYIPVNKLNLVQKYVGASSSATLDSLKTKAWDKRKAKVKKDVEQLAQKLIEHHAKQVMTPGVAFSKIGEDYISFEDAFPYEDTPDQHKATQEIMTDMSKPKAMDRLLCGDVGFGKTEVAMRACYRAVLDGKQVAWLVPTTVLAHQHLRTLIERFTPFGVSVHIIDRTTADSAKILEKLGRGEIDILIGTHRILAKDIKFRDLGLLVVDEEQHFGVLQKEKIKEMSYGIDVLTLTATPIPRTLQMALIGIRDLSLLTTPPKSRLATKTFVCPFEDKIIVDAIQLELSRGGQIFYVHNRVEELESVKTYLTNLMAKHEIPRIAIGHGKMHQNELEKTVVEFLDGKFDLLLCTTIVEAGIDMPNVNTILIQNADLFGLAQLYQLRGRVGRRSTRGYAYFLVQNEKFSQNTDGMKRLEILKDHQELGSGFVIASQDLEMRGSGEILGDEQSGKVSEIGLETYLQMLDDAIKNLNGIRIERKTEVELQIPLTIQIPEHYIESARERLLMYRRFFGTRDEQSLLNLVKECEDRFGQLPEEMLDLAEISRIRRLLLTFGAISLTVGEDGTECKLDQKILQSTDEHTETFVKRVLDLCNRHSKNMRITQDGRLLFPLKRKQFVQNKQASLQELKRMLSLLAGI